MVANLRPIARPLEVKQAGNRHSRMSRTMNSEPGRLQGFGRPGNESGLLACSHRAVGGRHRLAEGRAGGDRASLSGHLYFDETRVRTARRDLKGRPKWATQNISGGRKLVYGRRR